MEAATTATKIAYTHLTISPNGLKNATPVFKIKNNNKFLNLNFLLSKQGVRKVRRLYQNVINISTTSLN